MEKSEKQCGYLDNEGGFHKTAFDCNNSNLWIRIRELRDKVRRLTEYYAVTYEKRLSDYVRSGNASTSHVLEEVIKSLINSNADDLIEFTKKKQEIKDEMYELQRKAGKPRFLRKDWWLGDKLSIDKVFEDED